MQMILCNHFEVFYNMHYFLCWENCFQRRESKFTYLAFYGSPLKKIEYLYKLIKITSHYYDISL